MPTRARPRPPRGWRQRFIEHLAETANVSASAEAAGIHRKTAYRARKGTSTRAIAFAKEWDEALEVAVEKLEGEAWRRGVRGYLEPVWGNVTVKDDKGKTVTTKTVVGHIERYSDRLLEILLRAHKPAMYSENYRRERGPGGELPPEDPRVALADRFLTMVERKEAAALRELGADKPAPKVTPRRAITPADDAGEESEDD